MTTKRTHEKIAQEWLDENFGGTDYATTHHTLLAALEKAADAARQEEREVQVALWDKIESPLAMALERGGPNGTVHVGDLLAAVRALRLDARSRAEEPISELPKKE